MLNPLYGALNAVLLKSKAIGTDDTTVKVLDRKAESTRNRTPHQSVGFRLHHHPAIYKDRWEIELFFKALKSTLKVKSFAGTSENALRIQIWTALITLLLLKWLHHLSKAKWSLSNLASMLRLNLFTYRDLLTWVHEPFGAPVHPSNLLSPAHDLDRPKTPTSTPTSLCRPRKLSCLQ